MQATPAGDGAGAQETSTSALLLSPYTPRPSMPRPHVPAAMSSTAAEAADRVRMQPEAAPPGNEPVLNDRRPPPIADSANSNQLANPIAPHDSANSNQLALQPTAAAAAHAPQTEPSTTEPSTTEVHAPNGEAADPEVLLLDFSPFAAPVLLHTQSLGTRQRLNTVRFDSKIMACDLRCSTLPTSQGRSSYAHTLSFAPEAALATSPSSGAIAQWIAEGEHDSNAATAHTSVLDSHPLKGASSFRFQDDAPPPTPAAALGPIHQEFAHSSALQRARGASAETHPRGQGTSDGASPEGSSPGAAPLAYGVLERSHPRVHDPAGPAPGSRLYSLRSGVSCDSDDDSSSGSQFEMPFAMIRAVQHLPEALQEQLLTTVLRIPAGAPLLTSCKKWQSVAKRCTASQSMGPDWRRLFGIRRCISSSIKWTGMIAFSCRKEACQSALRERSSPTSSSSLPVM